jgi:hypothetical protein
MIRWFSVCCLVLGVASAWADGAPSQNPPGNYAGELLARVSGANPQLLGATISAAAPKSKAIVVVASTERLASGSPADPLDIAALSQDTTSKIDEKAARIHVRMQLHDVSGDTVGVLRLSFGYHAGTDAVAVGRNAAHIRDWLQRRVSHAGNLFDPVPYDRDAPASNSYAQQLVDEFMEKYPEIEILVIHATPPESDYNVIAGSSIGRIGKKADNDDMRCIFTGKPNLEVNSTGKRFESEMPLHDRAGEVIGALGVVVAYKQGDDKQALFKHADQIRVVMERRIQDSESLFRAGAQTAIASQGGVAR